MRGAGLLQAFLCFAPALSYLLFTGARASEVEGDGEQDLIPSIPNEVGRHMFSFLSIETYLAMMQTSKRALKDLQLPPKVELGMLARDFGEESAAGLMHTRVKGALMAKAAGKVQETLGGLLKELVDEIFTAPDGEVMDACRCALVADKRLSAAVWEEYVGIAVSDIAGAPASSEDATKKLEAILGIAARVGSLKTIQAIISSLGGTQIKANLGARLNYAVKWAWLGNHTEVVQFLLKNVEFIFDRDRYSRPISPDTKNSFALELAAEYGHVRVFRRLLAVKEGQTGMHQDTNLTAKVNCAIRVAAQNGRVEAVRFLLGMKIAHPTLFGGMDPAGKENHAIRWASTRGFFEVVKVLLEMKIEHSELFPGIDPAAKDNEAIVKAIANGRTEVVKVLLEKKEEDTASKFGYQNIDPAARSNEGPKQAFKDGHVEMLEFLRKKKTDRPDLYERLVLDW